MIKKELFLNNSQVSQVFGDINKLKNSYKVCTDTRNFVTGSCFLAIKGDRFDGFDFFESIKSSTDFIVFEESFENLEKAKEIKGKTLISVKSTVLFVQELAKNHTREWIKKGNKKVVGIAGSNGKTTTKEMLFHMIKGLEGISCIATQKNNNNHLGVPFTLLDITPETDVAIVELGSNHPGEMKVVCDIANPNIAVTTNIGDTHLEFFPTLKDVFEEEALVYKYVKKNKGTFFINEDDKYLACLESYEQSKSYGFKNEASYQFSFDRSLQQIAINEETFLENKNILGEHNFTNLAVAYLIASDIYPDKKKDFIKLASTFRPTANRSQWLQWKNVSVFLDAYNANPSSMKKSVSEFIEDFSSSKAKAGKALLIIGDMLELGENSKKYHKDLGAWMPVCDSIKVIYIGSFLKDFQEGFSGTCEGYSSVQDFLKNDGDKKLKEFQQIFVKASRALQLESIFAIK